MNQSRIRRTFRAKLAESTSTRLEQVMRRHDISRSDFARIMVSKIGPYKSFNSCYTRMSNLVNGRYVSDTFCANIINVIDKIEKDPKIVSKVVKSRRGFSKIGIGQSVQSRDDMFSADKNNKGNFFVRRLLRQSLKENV